jgi:hypothetical protein
MDVAFTRLDRNQCRATSVRQDGAAVSTTTTAKGGVPHDLEHLIIDRALGIRDGFWDCVWRGAEFNSLKVETGRARRRPQASNRAMTQQFNPLSEAIGGWIGAIFGRVIATSWRPPSPLPRDTEIAALLARPNLRRWVDQVRLETVLTELYEAREKWLALREGESLMYVWPQG